jgi:hypothetical protein
MGTGIGYRYRYKIKAGQDKPIGTPYLWQECELEMVDGTGQVVAKVVGKLAELRRVRRRNWPDARGVKPEKGSEMEKRQ